MSIEYEERQKEENFAFLESLDCYLNRQDEMEKEIECFTNDSKREITALICQNTREYLTYQAPYIRMLYVIKGSIRLCIDNKELFYEEGCLILSNQSTRIMYEQTSKEIEVLEVFFKDEYFTDYLLNQLVKEITMYRFFVENYKFDLKESNYFIFQFSTNHDIHLYLLLLIKQIVKMDYHDNEITKPLFLQIIMELNRSVKDYLVLKDSTISQNILYHEIIAYIEKNYKNVSLNDLASYFSFHPNYMSNFISKKSGSTFSKLLIDYRLKVARDFIINTDMSIDSIINEVGYQDRTFFFKQFKDKYKMTPKKLRDYEINKSTIKE